MSDTKQFLEVLRDSMVLSYAQNTWDIDNCHTVVYDPEVTSVITGKMVDSSTLDGMSIYLIEFDKPVSELIDAALEDHESSTKSDALLDASGFFKDSDRTVQLILEEMSARALKKLPLWVDN